MFTLQSLCASCFLILCLLGPALGQVVQPDKVERTISQSSSTVTASASADRVRFTAPSTVVQMHLQVYDSGGQLVFDVSSRGNVLDWTLQDSGGARLNPGAYVSVVTVKSLSGKLGQRIGSVSVGEKQIDLKRGDAVQMTVGQQQAVGPVEENSSLTILQEGETEAATTVAHDGTQGEINRSQGALSFRLGDFFAGKDAEQMRLTEEGNLGIGTDKPQAKLEVAGAIRTSKGIEFANGTDGNNVTKLTTTATGSLQQTMADGTVVANATGTGTQNKLAKWTDNAGTLGDSVVTESNGNIGIGTANPQAALHVIGNQFLKPLGATPTYEVLAGSDPNTTVMLTTDSNAFGWQIAPSNEPSDTIVQVLGQKFAAVPNRGEFGIYLGADGNSAFKVIQRGGPELMRVNRNGNVGIGNNNPTAKLDVAGNINTSTQYNIGGSRVLSVTGTNNVFAGVGAGQSNSTGNNNSFFGTGAGQSNTTARFNSFFGQQAGFGNMTGDSNSFFGQQAGQSNTFGNSNSFFGQQAGQSNTFGNGNSFFGEVAGIGNTTGRENSFFGDGAGQVNTEGNSNIFIGAFSGLSNSVDSNNTFIGTRANGVAGITNATAIGSRAKVTQSNSLVLGSINGVNSATADTNVGIGTTAPQAKLDLQGGADADGTFDPKAIAFSYRNGGFRHWIRTRHNSFEVGGNAIDFFTNTSANEGGSSAPGTGNQLVMSLDGGNVGIGTSPTATLEVKAGGTTLADAWTIRSSARFKSNIQTIPFALNKVLQLRGVSFDYKETQKHSIGFIAEEVGRVLPEVVEYEANGRDAKGLDYNRLTPVVVEAIKEQQQTIEQLKKQNVILKARSAKQEARLAALETMVNGLAQDNRRHRRHQ